jgi:hypothetical protein
MEDPGIGFVEGGRSRLGVGDGVGGWGEVGQDGREGVVGGEWGWVDRIERIRVVEHVYVMRVRAAG